MPLFQHTIFTEERINQMQIVKFFDRHSCHCNWSKKTNSHTNSARKNPLSLGQRVFLSAGAEGETRTPIPPYKQCVSRYTDQPLINIRIIISPTNILQITHRKGSHIPFVEILYTTTAWIFESSLLPKEKRS